MGINIKNYTSTVDAIKSMANIESYLVEIGAKNINKEYKDKVCVGIMFLLDVDELNGQTIPFKLTAEKEKCYQVLLEKKEKETVRGVKEGAKEKIREQAERTAWKIVSDWVEIQCSMVMLEQAKPLQMFLPYVYDANKNQTLHDKIIGGDIKLLT